MCDSIRQKFYLILNGTPNLDKQWQLFGRHIINYIQTEYPNINWQCINQQHKQQLVIQAINVIDGVRTLIKKTY